MGAKKKATPETKMLRLPLEYSERVRALAEKRGCFQARVVKEALDAYFSGTPAKATAAT